MHLVEGLKWNPYDEEGRSAMTFAHENITTNKLVEDHCRDERLWWNDNAPLT